MLTPFGLTLAAILSAGPAAQPNPTPPAHRIAAVLRPTGPEAGDRLALAVADVLADAARRDTPPAGRRDRGEPPRDEPRRDEPRRDEPRRAEPRRDQPRRRNEPEARPAPRDDSPRSLGEPQLRRRRPS
ncbi:MAG TPA: hypothetical protein VFS40_15300 [Gemmatimonadales bacterium]|nr:hypothetical protein [Gemmatimonadales bacterium]